MPNFQTVSNKDFFNWIFAQNDDKPVVMIENDFDTECGCLMVQYGKEVLKIKFSGCGYREWCDDDLEYIDSTVARFRDFCIDKIPFDLKTFGEIKAWLVKNMKDFLDYNRVEYS